MNLVRHFCHAGRKTNLKYKKPPCSGLSQAVSANCFVQKKSGEPGMTRMLEWREYAPVVSGSNGIELHDDEVEERIRTGGASGRDLYMRHVNQNYDPARNAELFAMLPVDDQAKVRFVEAQLHGVLQRLTTILS
jgi:hypothetical protein